jgi:hypothetical protein
MIELLCMLKIIVIFMTTKLLCKVKTIFFYNRSFQHTK